MDLMSFVNQGWADHASDAGGVWRRLPSGLALAKSGPDVGALARLGAHVAGEHLGLWDEGIAFQEACYESALLTPEAPASKLIARQIAMLAYCKGDRALCDTWSAKAKSGGGITPASGRIQLLAGVASYLVGQRRAEEAAKTLVEAISLASYEPGRDDPAARALAANGNNIAVALSELPTRTPLERDLMILGAETARLYWEIVGSWLEVERAEYRLALTMIAAGFPPRALQHAKLCHDICEDHNAVPYETFFAREALSRAYHASGQLVPARLERAEAAALIPRMKDDVQPECRDALARLYELLVL